MQRDLSIELLRCLNRNQTKLDARQYTDQIFESFHKRISKQH